MEGLTFILAIILIILFIMKKERYECKKEEKYLRSLNNLQALSEVDPIELKDFVPKGRP